jgi:hypothetical protein
MLHSMNLNTENKSHRTSKFYSIYEVPPHWFKISIFRECEFRWPQWKGSQPGIQENRLSLTNQTRSFNTCSFFSIHHYVWHLHGAMLCFSISSRTKPKHFRILVMSSLFVCPLNTRFCRGSAWSLFSYCRNREDRRGVWTISAFAHWKRALYQ